MAHRFNTARFDPYSHAAEEVERHAFRGGDEMAAGASAELFSEMADAIVAAIGDVGAAAFRLGLNQRPQIEGIAAAVSALAKPLLLSYIGEYDPEPALRTLEQSPRLETLSDVDRDEMAREVAQTRQLEELLLRARRLPDLIDFAGTMGLEVPTETLGEAPLLIAGAELPSPEAP